jgi:hypothetical protein
MAVYVLYSVCVCVCNDRIFAPRRHDLCVPLMGIAFVSHAERESGRRKLCSQRESGGKRT